MAKIFITPFASFVMKKLNDFVYYYTIGHTNEPDNFPLEMSEEDWWEQFLAYLSLENNND